MSFDSPTSPDRSGKAPDMSGQMNSCMQTFIAEIKNSSRVAAWARRGCVDSLAEVRYFPRSDFVKPKISNESAGKRLELAAL
jgi:hypothetical protein